MNKRRSNKKVKEDRSERHAAVQAKRAASAMASVADLARELGCGKNVAYEIVSKSPGQIGAWKLKRRWLIPRSVLAKVASGELKITLPAEDES